MTDPNDDIRDPEPPTWEEEMTDEERDEAENEKYNKADDDNDADYYRDWDKNG